MHKKDNYHWKKGILNTEGIYPRIKDYSYVVLGLEGISSGFKSVASGPQGDGLMDMKMCQYKTGGYVEIRGEGVKEDTTIGLGIAHFLASIPNEGILPDEFIGTEKSKKDWLLEDLLPAGLVKEESPGRYIRTVAANNAAYKTFPSS